MFPDGGGAPVYRPLFYGPRTSKAAFEICAGTILTQNTAWNNALSALISLNGAEGLSPEAICRMNLRTLGGLIRSSGFYRQKAARLKIFSRYLLSRHPEGVSKWFSAGATEELRTELLKISGIGPETADSMVLYAAGKPKFVVDAYTQRLLGRLGPVTETCPAILQGGGTYERVQSVFESALPRDHRVYNEYHALIVALCKNYCRKTKPRCEKCPLGNMCGRKGVMASELGEVAISRGNQW